MAASDPQRRVAWRAIRDGWVAGRRVARGERVEMTEAAARYETCVERIETAGRGRGGRKKRS